MNTTHPAFNPAIAYGVYKTRRLAFFIAGLTAFVMSTYFVVGYLVDGTRFRDWGVNEWFFALPGIGICLVMTAMQIVLYAKDSKAATLTTVIAVGVAAGFSILSEIGQGMERDNLRMTSRSLQSPTYQAIVASMASASSATHTPYAYDLQQAQERLATCRKKVRQGIYRDCAESEARLQAIRDMIHSTSAAQSERALALAQTAKAMERDENNYHPLVNLIRNSFGWTGIVASFALSLTIIVFFEYAFHYLGRRLAEARDTLLIHGYDTTTLPRKMPRLLGSSAPIPGPAPTPLQVPVQLPVENPDNSEKSSVYAQSQQARVGQVVACPNCGQSFQKSNKWHLFCSNNRKPRT
ncbi:MAG: hypothetical protein KC434_06980, partial [Anaerolineales bacterium]|nr:hypothetical protein [Anaerolineales bacterium]